MQNSTSKFVFKVQENERKQMQQNIRKCSLWAQAYYDLYLAVQRRLKWESSHKVVLRITTDVGR